MDTAKNYTNEELSGEKELLLKKYKEFREMDLSLDLSRGKPCAAQLELSSELLSLPGKDDYLSEEGIDCRNYDTDLRGLIEVRRLFGEILEVPADNIILGGNASLALLHDALTRAFLFGPLPGFTPWCKYDKIKFICPVPGYDWHFHVLEQLGVEMISVKTGPAGPDPDEIRELAKDPAVKGMICVPKYGNPSGITYSEELVRTLAEMETAAPDFRIFWDNAYCIHHLYDEPDKQDHLANIFDLAAAAGHEDRVLIFASTSKVTFPGAGISCMAASEANIQEMLRIRKYRLVNYDKLNYLRHIRFLPDMKAVTEHMRKQAALLRPKFEYIDKVLTRELKPLGYGDWNTPRGGYFICYYAPKGCAKRIVSLCKEMGVTLTPAGAAYPHDYDPDDSAIRLAPSFADMEDIPLVMDVFVTAVKLAVAEKES